MTKESIKILEDFGFEPFYDGSDLLKVLKKAEGKHEEKC